MNSQDVSIITVAAVRAKAAIIAGEIGGVGVEMMLDSGSTVSLIRQSLAIYSYRRQTTAQVGWNVGSKKRQESNHN